MVTVLLLAGGRSRRMGTDKALMRGGVERLRQLAIQCHADRIVTLCGAKERERMFKGEVWADPLACDTLSDVIEWAFSLIEGDVQLICCDAFNLEKEGLQRLLSSGGGVPVDEEGNRQPLLANCPKEWTMRKSNGTVSSLFQDLESLDLGLLSRQMKNFNSPVD
ncbi:MAG: NTP transferase domain-containing protein [Candidatus Poseidoniaceae archaeon]|nr:NTP transferase domain-containing protein [Candidatus Poseidoniaceae archaeon]